MRAGFAIEPPLPHSITIEIAGIACRIESDHLKPILWAREGHPEFLSPRAPDIKLSLTADERYWLRGLPWIAPSTVDDVPCAVHRGSSLIVRSAYYQATMDGAGRRVEARIASGFRVHGLMRTLYALLLLSRGGLLVRGARVGNGVTCALSCSRGAVRGQEQAVSRADFVAVAERDGRYFAYATPFLDGGPAADPPLEMEVSGLSFPHHDLAHPPDAPSPAELVQALISNVLIIDRTEGAIHQVLRTVTRFVAAVTGSRRVPGAC